MLEHDILLREMRPSDIGAFILFKSKFIAEGKNHARLGRCDNADYGPVSPVLDTPYEWQGHTMKPRKPNDGEFVPSVRQVTKFEKVVTAVPDFYIVYFEFKMTVNGQEIRSIDMRHDPVPASMWYGRTIFSLFKNIREWSFMAEEPFNMDHPMATLSKRALEVLNPSQSIIDEIDAMPDMHLAKFLKGQENYRDIPMPYPEASQQFKDWVVQLSVDFADVPLEERLG
jgi:hypothetical protein